MGAAGPQAIHLCRPEAVTREDRVVGAPRELGGCFLAGARSRLRWGPRWAWRTPPAVVRGLCEAMAQCYRGWEPDTTSAGPAVRVFVDAARRALTSGANPSYCVGSWGPGGADLALCPAWVTTQQAVGDAGSAGRCARATSVAPRARGGQHGGAGPAALGEGGGGQGPAAAHPTKDCAPPPLDGAAGDPLLGAVRAQPSGLDQ